MNKRRMRESGGRFYIGDCRKGELGMKVAVKVCGVRREADVEGLRELGVQYIGLNFSPRSPRYIEPRKARSLLARAPGLVSVGVFVDAHPDELERVIDEVGLDMVQLHGSESPGYAARIPLPVIRAFPSPSLSRYLMPEDPEDKTGQDLPRNIRFLLIDTLVKKNGEGIFGGSGESFDWSALRSTRLVRPYFLAGGLGPHNLREALSVCRPHAVDLNSRVESSPGEKDMALVKQCLDILSEPTSSASRGDIASDTGAEAEAPEKP